MRAFKDTQIVLMTREESIRIYKTYSRKLFNVSFRIVGDGALAEEIMQDTVLKFIKLQGDVMISHAGQVSQLGHAGQGGQAGPICQSGQDRVGAWLVRTCVRASIDALRKLKREREFLEDFASHEAVDYSEDDYLPQEYSVEAVKQAIESLPGPYRLILTLVLIEGLDYEEISGFTGDNEGALRTRFSRARKMLVGRLKERR